MQTYLALQEAKKCQSLYAVCHHLVYWFLPLHHPCEAACKGTDIPVRLLLIYAGQSSCNLNTGIVVCTIQYSQHHSLHLILYVCSISVLLNYLMHAATTSYRRRSVLRPRWKSKSDERESHHPKLHPHQLQTFSTTLFPIGKYILLKFEHTRTRLSAGEQQRYSKT